MKNTWIK